MKTVKASEVLAKVIQLAVQYPKARYYTDNKVCYNFNGKVDDGPDSEGCIIGQAMQLLGFTPQNCPDGMAVSGLISRGIIEKDKDVGTQLQYIQTYQDQKVAWGLVLNRCVGQYKYHQDFMEIYRANSQSV